MKTLKLINNHVLSILTKINSLIKCFLKKKKFPIVFSISLFLVVFFAYLILVAPLPIFSGTSYKEVASDVQLNNIYKALWAFNYQIPSFHLLFTLGIIGGLLLFVVIYILANKKMNWKMASGFVVISAIVLCIFFSFSTDAIVENQHDVWSSGSNLGHFSITCYIYDHGLPPSPRVGGMEYSYQLYHPKFHHYLMAGFMKFMSLFLSDDYWVLYQSCRILTCFMTCISIYVIYLILKQLKISDRMTFFAILFIAFFPAVIRLGGATNNDTTMYFFVFLAILFSIRWWQKQNYFNTVFLAIFVGLGMASKLNAFIIAIPIAVMFIIKLITYIRDKNFQKILPMFVTFFVICIPLGLFWPIYNKLTYGQSFFFLYLPADSLKVEDTYNFADRFLSFPIPHYFVSPFLKMFQPGNEWNLWSTLLKSGIFDETNIDYVPLQILGTIFNVINFLLVLLVVVFLMWIIIKSIIDKRLNNICISILPVCLTLGVICAFGGKDYLFGSILFLGLSLVSIIYLSVNNGFKNGFKNVYLASIATLFIVMFVYYNIKAPYACTINFRYVTPIIIPFTFLLAKGLDNAFSLKHRRNIFLIPSISVVTLFVLSSIIFSIGSIA